MARNIIIFVADGLRPGSVNSVDTPTLYSVRQNGVNFTDSHSLFPTFTTPNASAIATGHYLGDTGDFSNTVYTGYPVINANGSVTPFIENDPILADINANSNLADPDTSFSKNNFLTEESILAYARLNGYSTAAIGKLGPVAIFDVTQDVRTGGTATPNITPKTVIIDDSTFISSVANATNPPVNSVGSQSGIPLSPAIANDFNNAGLIGQNIPGTTTPATTVGSIRSNQPSGNLTTAGTLNSNAQQQQFFADATTKAILPQFVSDISSNASNGFAAVYWSRDPDGTQHNNGDAFNAADPGNNSLSIGINGPTSKKGIQDADANLKQIIDYLKATPDPANPGKTLYDNTDIFVTADHGFSTISKQAVGVTFDTAGQPTYINTTSYAASLSYFTTDANGVKTPTVHAGFLPPGFVAIDLAHDLGSTLYDPNKPTATVTTSNIDNIQYTAVDPTKGQLTTSGNGVIGGNGTVVNGAIDPNTQVVVAANGGSDLLYVPSNDPDLVKKIVSLLAQKDYISGIFTDDKFGDVPGALKLSTIGLQGTAELPTPSIAINFKTFSTNPNDPNDPQAQVEVADTTLQQGQGMHGSFGRGDTFNNMAAIGPDFKSGYVDNAPVSNADVVPTLASILGWTLPSVGTLNGRAATESLVNGPDSASVTSTTLTSAPVNGVSTILKTQTVGGTPYFDVAGFAGGTDGLAPVTFKPGNLLVSRSVYTAPNLKVGDTLPNGSTAVADGSYPNVFANESVDPSFGVTSPIFIDQVTTSGKLIKSLNLTDTLKQQGLDISTSFPSKSELGLTLSPDGAAVTFLAYKAPPKALDISNSNTPSVIDPTNLVGNLTAQRAVVQFDDNFNLQVTPIDAYSGNNGRNVVLGNNGFYYTVGNAGNSGTGVTGATLSALSDDTGVQMIAPGVGGDTTVVGQVKGTSGSLTGYQRGFSITDLPGVTTPDKTGKDDNFRGLTLNPFDNSLYVSKGSGGNGVNTVYKVTPTGSSLPTLANAGTSAISILPGFSTTLASSTTGVVTHPFGLWFANPTTLYVADEGTPLTTTGAKAVPLTDAAKDSNAGLEKWSLVNGTWVLDYTLQNGLNLGTSYTVADGPNGEKYPTTFNPATAGLRNITGKVNFDGTVSIYGVTSTVGAETDQGADPNEIVAIADNLSYTTAAQAATESFTTIEGPVYGNVYRGVSLAPTVSTPFSGVAAGDATSNDAILWTRTFDPQTKKGVNATDLIAQVSTDANFGAIAFSYSVPTRTDGLDHDGTVKVDATGLKSGTQYYYRFVSPAGDISPVGTFKTALDANTQAAVRFGFSGDADGLMRPFGSTANFGKLNLDFFGFLGDTIYETASSGSPAAADPIANPTQALVDYHRKYLENIQPVSNGGFAGLETLYSSQGDYTLLDNHELGNKQLINGGAPSILAPNSGNGTNNTTYDVNKTGSFINQTAGFKTLEQAYTDYQPIKEKIVSAPDDPRSDGTQQLYNANQWGQNLIYINTDTRSYRDVRLKTTDANGNVTTTDDTGARADNPDRTYLGKTQLAWLKQNLLDAQKNGTVWKFVAVSDPIDQIGAIGSGADGGKSWIGGYRAERNDLLKFIADNGIKNVVFLATDDHQNRVNELTYLDNINDPTSVKVLPNALSIVDGPIGATGPDAITDHSFTNIKSLADKLAATQTAAGVNPVGLSPNFAGLKNVVREGDPNADTLRQPIDFYSPDTFNYTTFDISADGKTLNVNVQGINSSAVNTFPEPSAANPVRSILSFSLDAAPPTLQVTAATPNTTEGSSTPGLFHVATDGNVLSPLTFNYTLGGSATNGVDYANLSGTATIAAGQSSVDIQVTAASDALVEGDESVTLSLQNGAGYSTNAAKSTAVVTIADKPPVVTTQPPKNSAFSHVLVISIDGLHNSDLSVANLQPSLTNIKRLQSQGITYTNAFSSAPSDSFPGELNYITGANPGTTGVFYDKSYSRTLYAPGTTKAQIADGTAKPGTGVEFAENVDASWNNGTGGTLDGGQGFDVTQLPVDSNGNPVYPNQYLKVNTIFDVANAAGLKTAWSDKHPAAYTVLAGNAQDPTKFNFATGQVGSISDYSSLEINAAVAIDPTKPGPLPTSLGALVDQSTGTPFSNTNPNIASNFFNDATKGNQALFKAPPTGFNANQFTSVATTSTYDDYKVKQILNEIDGLDHTGTNATGTPAIFGLNLQAVSVGEKEPATQFNGGGIDANGNARPDLVSAFAHTDASIGLILDELKKQGLDSSTLVVLTAKHGQNPAKDPTVGLSSTFDSKTGQAGGDGGLTAIGALLARNGIELDSENGGDTSSLLFLKNKSDVQKAVALLNAKDYSFDTAKDLISDPTGNTLFSAQDAAAQGTVLYGQSIINAGLGDPFIGDRTPDIVVALNTGYFFGNATKKRAEHGGFTDDDTHVALIAASAGLPGNLQGTIDTKTVSTTQISPTVLEALGLDPKQLQGVQIDGTQDLGISPNALLPSLKVDTTTTTVVETSSTPGVFRVTTSGNIVTPLTFNYALSGTATNGVDYNNLTGTATIATGQSYVDIPVTPVDDSLAEGNETVAITLGKGADYNINLAKSAATIDIIDNEPTPVGTPGDDNLIAIPGTNFDGQGNTVFTGAGNDTVDLSISPTAGNNRIYLGSGDDTIFVSKNDRVFGGTGNDTFDATDARGGNHMSGGAGDDIFFLGQGDRALGGDGNDKFYVQTGGNNLLSGGAGNDQFWLVNAEVPSGSNTVLDFQIGTDVIGFSGAASLGISATTLKLSQVGADTDILFGSQTLAVLSGIQASDLSLTNPNQFVFA